MNILRTTLMFVTLFLLSYSMVSAGVADSAIKTWNTPPPDATYQYADPVIFSGTVQIPAGWVGRVRVCRDMGSPACINSFLGSQSFDNSQTGTTTETFSVDTGAWSSGAHVARIAFDGFAGCRLVCAQTDTACQIANNSDGDPTNNWCPGDTENSVPDQTYPTRNITVGPPPTPSLAVSTNPVHFWENVVNTAPVTQSVILTNTGAPGTTAVGTFTQTSGAGKFLCQSGCTYSILAGGEHTVTLSFDPGGVVGESTGTFDLSCAGCVVPLQTLSVDGGTIAVPSPAEITLDATAMDFFTVNVGAWQNVDILVTNTGGTPMDGTVDLNNSQVVCEGSCDFTLNASESVTKRFRYTPTVADPLSGVTATFRAISGGASTVTIPVAGEGNDEPILVAFSHDTQDDVYDGQEIVITDFNEGASGAMEFDVANRGAGVLSATLSGLPVGIFTCVTNCGPYTNVTPYNQTGDYRRLRVEFTLPDGAEQILPLTFTDTTPGGSGQVINVTVRIVPNTEPVSEMVGGYPCNLNFGNVLVGDTVLPRPDPEDEYWYQDECGVKNVGMGALTVTLPNFTLNGTGRYECVTGPGLSCGTFTLGPDEEAMFTYRFIALAADPDTDMHHWYPIESVATFEGLPAWDSIHVHAAPMSIDLALTPLSEPEYDFGVVNMTETSVEKMYTLSLARIGGVDDTTYYSVLPGSISYVVGDTTHFRCTQQCAETLSFSGNDFEDIRVVFEPASDIGIITETVTIPYTFGGWANAPVVTPLELALSGEGNDQPILGLSGDIDASSLEFGSVNVAESRTLVLTLSNIGVGNLTGTFGAFSAPFSCLSAECAGLTIPGGESRNVSVRFTPTTDTASELIIPLTTTGGDSTLTLRGAGKLEPELTLSTSFINFDTLTDPATLTSVGDVRDGTFRITNSGLGTMSGSVELAAPTSNFLFPPQTFTLDGGDSVDMSVQFAPVRDSVPLSAQLLVEAYNASPGVSSDANVAYAFNDSSGTALSDDSGNGNTATLIGGATLAPGKNAQGVLFSGSGQRVRAPDSPDVSIDGSMTLEAWVNPSSLSAQAPVIMKGNSWGSNYNFRIDNGVPMWSWSGGSTYYYANNPIPLNTWSHVAVVHDAVAKTVTFYINGVPNGTATENASPYTVAGSLYVGGYPSGEYFPGAIDDVRIYHRALSASQVVSDMDTPVVWSASESIALSGTGAFASLTDFRGTQPYFGPVVFGKDKTLTLILKNFGVRPLGQGTFEFPEGSPFECVAPIGVSGKCEYDIGPVGTPTAEQSLTVKFTPTGFGAASVQMGLSSLPDYTIEFTGIGIPPRFNYKEQ